MFATWGIPQWIVAGMFAISFVAAVVLHGKARENYDGGVIMMKTSFLLVLLIWGGFWR